MLSPASEQQVLVEIGAVKTAVTSKAGRQMFAASHPNVAVDNVDDRICNATAINIILA